MTENIFINIMTIFVALSLLGLILMLKKNIIDLLHKISNQIRFLSKNAQQFTFESFIQKYCLLIFFIWFSFLIFSSILVFLLFKYNIAFEYLEFTNVFNLTHNYILETTNPLENISIFIILLSGFIVYAYFFGLVSSNPYEIMKNETQKKYFWFFENLFYIGFAYTFFIVAGLTLSKFDVINPNEIAFFFYAWVDLILTMLIVNGYEKYQKNYDNIEKFNDFLNLKYEKKYDKISHFLKRWLIVKGEVCSVLIFFLTLEFAYLGYLLNLNIFCLIFLESSLILTHMWISRISQTPKDKKNIELKSKEKLKDVYIAGETDDYLVIISKETGMSKIMKSSIDQILYQNTTETNK